MLYQIKCHPRLREHYNKCSEYLYRFAHQTQPPDMDYKEWAKHKITEKKVIAYFKNVIAKQNAPEPKDKIALVKQKYSFVYKGYSSKTKGMLSEQQKTPVPIFITSTCMKDYYNFGYKDMDETMGPGDCDCPKSIIALLSETDNEYALYWRQKCLDRCNGKPKLSKLPIGTVIEFQRNGETVRLIKHKPAYQFKTPFWWDGTHYVKKKYIPNDFIIIQQVS